VRPKPGDVHGFVVGFKGDAGDGNDLVVVEECLSCPGPAECAAGSSMRLEVHIAKLAVCEGLLGLYCLEVGL